MATTQDEGTIARKGRGAAQPFTGRTKIRTKVILQQSPVLIPDAAEPEFSVRQLPGTDCGRGQHITPIIALNKSDLVEPFARAWGPAALPAHAQRRPHYGLLRLCLAMGPKPPAKHLARQDHAVLGARRGRARARSSTCWCPVRWLRPTRFRRHSTRASTPPPARPGTGSTPAHHGPNRLTRIPGIRSFPIRPHASGPPDARPEASRSTA